MCDYAPSPSDPYSGQPSDTPTPEKECTAPGPAPDVEEQPKTAEPEVAAWENEGGAVETPESVEEERIEAIAVARGIPRAAFTQPPMPPELLTTSDLNAFSLALNQMQKRLEEHLGSSANDRHSLRGRDLSDISRGVQHLQYEIAAALTIMRATPLEHHIAETLGDHDRVDIVHRGRMLEIAKRLGEKFSISQKRPPVTRKVIGEN